MDLMSDKLKSVKYNGCYFDRREEAAARLCTAEGWFSCQVSAGRPWCGGSSGTGGRTREGGTYGAVCGVGSALAGRQCHSCPWLGPAEGLRWWRVLHPHCSRRVLQGPFDSADCPCKHSINPYSNRESRILFSTWNLDHVYVSSINPDLPVPCSS